MKVKKLNYSIFIAFLLLTAFCLFSCNNQNPETIQKDPLTVKISSILFNAEYQNFNATLQSAHICTINANEEPIYILDMPNLHFNNNGGWGILTTRTITFTKEQNFVCIDLVVNYKNHDHNITIYKYIYIKDSKIFFDNNYHENSTILSTRADLDTNLTLIINS